MIKNERLIAEIRKCFVISSVSACSFDMSTEHMGKLRYNEYSLLEMPERGPKAFMKP